MKLGLADILCDFYSRKNALNYYLLNMEITFFRIKLRELR